MVPNVVITGGNGVLGRRLTELLLYLRVKYRNFSGDITNEHEIREFIKDCEPTHIIHLAAVVDVSLLKEKEKRFFDVNVGGTATLMRAIAKSNIKPWVFYASSSHVYAPSKKGISESDPIGPRNIYGLTKHLGEQVALYYAEYMEVPICAGRIFSLYDEHQRGNYLYPSLMEKVRNNHNSRPIYIKNGNAIRDFSHASTIAKYIADLTLSKYEGIINIASGNPRTVMSFAQSSFPDCHSFLSTGSGSDDMIIANVEKLRKVIGHE